MKQYFKVGNKIKLKLYKRYNLLIIKKKDQQFTGPFIIKEKIGTLVYKLDFPAY